jgi:hypothetical protein
MLCPLSDTYNNALCTVLTYRAVFAVQLRGLRKDVGDLLRAGKTDLAQIRIEGVMRDEAIMHAYEGVQFPALKKHPHTTCELAFADGVAFSACQKQMMPPFTDKLISTRLHMHTVSAFAECNAYAAARAFPFDVLRVHAHTTID